MILAVMRTHLARLRRDRAAFVLAFVVPIVFFSIFAGIFGTSRGGGTRRVSVGIVDEDGSENSRRLVAALKAEKGVSVVAGKVPAAGGPDVARKHPVVRGWLWHDAIGHAHIVDRKRTELHYQEADD